MEPPGPTGRFGARRVGVRPELALFIGSAVLALVLVAIGAVLASRVLARSEALSEAEQMTARMAELVIAPLLGEALNGDDGSRNELTRVINNRMRDGYLIEVVVWSAGGAIVWADDTAIIGTRHEIPMEAVRAINEGASTASYEDKPESTSLRPEEMEDGFVEVYVPLDVPGYPPLAFEAYYNYSRVNDAADDLLTQLIPLVLVPLVVLMIFQVPIVVSLGLRIRRHDAERSALLEHSLSVSARERIRIAADLHDGPIQELAGMGYALGGLARSIPNDQQPLIRSVQDTMMVTIESLRRLMTDLYPPDLSASTLPASLSLLAEPLREQGADVMISVLPLPAMNMDAITTVYRVAHEALANVAEHSRASRVEITLGLQVLDAPKVEPATSASRFHIELVISDDGIGLDPNYLSRREQGHLGIHLLIDRVEQLGGTLSLTNRPEGGTELRALVPIDGNRRGVLLHRLNRERVAR